VSLIGILAELRRQVPHADGLFRVCFKLVYPGHVTVVHQPENPHFHCHKSATKSGAGGTPCFTRISTQLAYVPPPSAKNFLIVFFAAPVARTVARILIPSHKQDTICARFSALNWLTISTPLQLEEPGQQGGPKGPHTANRHSQEQ
jgi:hypothetical protein